MKTVYVIALCLLTQCAFAKEINRGSLKRGSLNWYAKVAVDYHINMRDTEPFGNSDQPALFKKQDDFFTSEEMPGIRVGLGLQRVLPFGLFFLVRHDLKIVKHTVELNYIAAENGYTGSNYTHKQKFEFTEYALNTRIAAGYSQKVAKGKGAVELATGIGFHIPISGETNEGELIHAQTDVNSPYNDIIMYQQVGWGDQKPYDNGRVLVPINIMGDIQVAYKFIQPSVFPNRSLRVGLDFTTALTGNYLNTIEVTTVRPDRVTGNKYKFRDQHIAFGVFVAIEL